MGLYDSLFVKCPKCKSLLEFQSKSGQCIMSSFNEHHLPPEVAVGMNGEIVRCQFCNKRIKLECKIPRRVNIKLIITKGLKFDYDGNYNAKHQHSKKRQKELAKFLGVRDNEENGTGGEQ